MVLKRVFSDEIKNEEINGLSENLLSDAMKLVTYDNVLDAKLFMDLQVLCNHGISAVPDTAGMAHSLELRSPYLNHKIIEFAAKLSIDHKVKNPKNPLYNKMVLKQLACDYLDKEDVFAKKFGFGYFIDSYILMRTKWKNHIEDSIFDPLVHETGFFNMKYLKKMWENFLCDKLDFRGKLILSRYVMFCVWYKYNFRNC